jgi:hypothetical protein
VENTDRKYIEKYRRQREKIKALLKTVDEKKNCFFKQEENIQEC